MSPLNLQEGEALTPKLTAWDRKVLGCLHVWEPRTWEAYREPGCDWRSKWQVAEQLNTEDVKGVREVLEALVGFGYAMRHDKRGYVAIPKKDEA